jgi:hypothetical protein
MVTEISWTSGHAEFNVGRRKPTTVEKMVELEG